MNRSTAESLLDDYDNALDILLGAESFGPQESVDKAKKNLDEIRESILQLLSNPC